MRFITVDEYTATNAWDALDLAIIENASIRLHWTDRPYTWHTNVKPEVFVVLSGAVDMHYRESGSTHVRRLDPGMVCVVEAGDEHVAHPRPEARILVAEEKGAP